MEIDGTTYHHHQRMADTRTATYEHALSRTAVILVGTYVLFPIEEDLLYKDYRSEWCVCMRMVLASYYNTIHMHIY